MKPECITSPDQLIHFTREYTIFQDKEARISKELNFLGICLEKYAPIISSISSQTSGFT
jgi:hypothetical protein